MHPTAILLMQSVELDNVPAAAELLARNQARLDGLIADGCSELHQILAAMKSPGMADLFLQHGLTTATSGHLVSINRRKRSPIIAGIKTCLSS